MKACFVLHADLFKPWPVMRAAKEIEVLKENGFEVHVLSWIKDASNLPPKEIKDGIHLHRFFLQPPKKSFLKRLLTYRKIGRELSRKIRDLKPNVVVCHDLEMLYPGVKAVKSLKVPLFYDAHENWPEMVAQNSKFEAKCFAYLERRLLKNVTYSYTYGDDLAEKFSAMGFSATALYNSKSLDAVPDFNEGDIERMKTDLGLEKNGFIIGYAGSVNLEDKGLKQTMDALKELPGNMKFLVAGGGGKEEDLDKVKRYASEKEVQERVIFTGRVQSDVLLRYAATFDIGTVLYQPTSANQIAGVPNKLFDYMAIGVPMIVSNFPNMRKIVVEESRCGLAVDPTDISKISEAIMRLHDHPEEAKEKGENGREKFENNYCWDVQKKKLIDSHPIWRGK